MAGHHDHEPHDHHGQLSGDQAAAWAGKLVVEAEALVGFVMDAVRRVDALRGPDAPPVRRVLDVGSGPGVFSCELARAFPEAEVVALDPLPAMLDRVLVRAERLGLAARIRTQQGELPGGLVGAGPADVIWMSMALHHVEDQGAALRAVAPELAPGGFVVIHEHADERSEGLVERIEQAGLRVLEYEVVAVPAPEPVGTVTRSLVIARLR